MSNTETAATVETILESPPCQALLDKGRQQGELSPDEVVAALESVELTPSLIDEVPAWLSRAGIRLAEDPQLAAEIAAVTDPAITGGGSGDPGPRRRLTDRPAGFTGGSVTDPVRAYLQAIGSVALLDAAEEQALAAVWTKGRRASEQLIELARVAAEPSAATLQPLQEAHRRGLDARRSLVEANLRLVVSLAKRYRYRGVSFLDLIQEGNAGLVRAVERFDPERGARLATHATWWIRQSIGRSIAEQARTIRIPAHVYDTLNRVLRAQRLLLQEQGREPSVEELAFRMKMAPEKVRSILSLDQSTVSLEPGDGDGQNVSDTMADAGLESPGAKADHNELSALLRDALSRLGDRERELMQLRFGLDDGRQRTLEELAREFGVSKERVRQIEAKTLARLRAPLARRQLEEFLRE